MLNQLVIMGRIKSMEGNKIILSIQKQFKNKDGEYDNDIIELNISDEMAKNIEEHLKEGDLLGIKGKIETGNKIVIEKLTFLSSKESIEGEQ